MNNTFKEDVRARLLANAEGVCRHLLPNGSKKGNSWVCGNVKGDEGQSCNVDLSKGLWYDHAEGHGGDMFSLWAENRGLGFVDAMHEAGRFVGLSQIERPKPPKPKGYGTQNMGSVRGSPVMEHMKSRGLKEQILQRYEIRSHAKPVPSYENEHFIAYQFRTPGGTKAFLKATGITRNAAGKKEIWSTEPYATLWGWWTVKPRHREVVLTEGEEDAMSVCQMLGDEDIPCLSLPSGVSNLNWVDNDYEALQQFDKFYLLLDSDDAGESAAKKVAARLGLAKCFRVALPPGYKDANEVLVKGPEAARTPLEWLKAAKTYDPPSLSAAFDVAASTLEMRRERRAFGEGDFVFDVPFTQLPGEYTILQGFTGGGKSTLSYQMALYDLMLGKSVLYVSMEIPKEQVNENMCQQWCARFPKDTDILSFDEWCGRRFIPIDDERDSMTWNTLKGDIEYAAQRFGIDAVYIDSIHFLADKKDLEKQDLVSKECKKLAAKHKIHITLIAHSRFGEGGEYAQPRVDDVEGSKGILKPAHNIITHWRNVKKEEVVEDGGGNPEYDKMAIAPDAVLRCHKQRNGYRKRWKADLWYHFDSMTYRTSQLGKPGVSLRRHEPEALSQGEIDENPFG